MAAMTAPVELPTGRRSYYSPSTAPDIHDPNWIPVLDGSEQPNLPPFTEKEVSPYNTASFSPFPTRSPSPKRRTPVVHNYSKSSQAPESITSELEAEPLPPRQSSFANKKNHAVTPSAIDAAARNLKRTSAEALSSDGQDTVTSDGGADTSTAPSTSGAVSVLDDYYVVPGQRPESKEEIRPPVALSTRSSIASARKSTGIPTSKYNRKPVPSMATSGMRPPTIQSQPQSPRDSPRMTSAASTRSPTPLVQPLPSPQIPPRDPTPPQTTPKLGPMKSSASERRLRALHSHPSNISLQAQSRSRANSSSDDADIMPKPPSIRHKPRKSTDSRATTPRSAIFDSQIPTPAPTTPLPQLPPEACRPLTRDGSTAKLIQAPAEAHLASAIPSFQPGDHTEMASFMTSTHTVIFRRFDDVHVRLLLCLQDEISQLEKELLKLEGGGAISGEQNFQRTKILQELRRVVAEYDHLFANWSQMQANKASKETMQHLRQWLEKPSTGAEGAVLEKGAKDDLDWLEKSKDLSSVALGALPNPTLSKSVKPSPGAAFAAFFNSCAGKRK